MFARSHLSKEGLPNKAGTSVPVSKSFDNFSSKEKNESVFSRSSFSWSLRNVRVSAHDENRHIRASNAPTPVQLPRQIQPKLEVGGTDNSLEREANRVAEQVLRVPDAISPSSELRPKGFFAGKTKYPVARASGNGQFSSSHEQPQEQRAANSSQTSTLPTAPAVVHEALRSPGKPLDSATRAFFEPRFQSDFSHVRVHTGAQATDSAKAIGARAYAAGSHVVLARDHVPKNLLAHELTHVVQQTGANENREGLYQSPHIQIDNSAPSSTVRRQPLEPDAEEYIPSVGAAERQPTDPKKNKPEVLGRLDLDELLQKNPQAKKRIEAVAKELDLDPGLLAASLYAETATEWTKTTGKIHSEVLGMDDWFDPALEGRLKGIIKAHPGLGLKFTDVKATGEQWNSGTEKTGGNLKPRGELNADKSVPAWGVYTKMQVEMLHDVLAKEPALQRGKIRNLEDLTPESRLTIERLATNSGVGFAKQMFMKLAAGSDIPRKGGIRRDKHHAFRTATLHMARAVHLDQTVFGRSPNEYKPPPEPISHSEAAMRYNQPWLKDLPEWVTPIDY
jgi:hypothetical protein